MRQAGPRRLRRLIVFALGASIVSGGSVTILVLPPAVVIAVGALIFTMWGRATGSRHATEPRSGGGAELPMDHPQTPNTAAVPSTPDQLVDAKQTQQ